MQRIKLNQLKVYMDEQYDWIKYFSRLKDTTSVSILLSKV